MKKFDDFVNEGRFPEKPAVYTSAEKRKMIEELMSSILALQEGDLAKSTLLFVEQIGDDTIEITLSEHKLKLKLLKAVPAS